MTNPLHPDRMTAAERLDTVAALLAAGIARALGTSAEPGEETAVCLDFSRHESVHADGRKTRGDRRTP
ncbi:hypothetical protein [Prosthecodimorpha hirschii]|uniref:hypothetical protein n=1 Tax=Prosthecodimorpha hirschii TaxID=665126 RepID=UPI0015E4395B|nr:hypothetical protein [Prosthecomicrobium hirschii]